MRAVANRIVLLPLPRENKEGSIFLPESRGRGTRTKGDAIEARVVAVGPEVRREIVPGVILLLDPSALDDCWFKHEEIEYVSVPDEPFHWKEAKGYFFGAYRPV